MSKLPIGIQSFEDLRRNQYLYIDKTRYIGQLLDSGKVWFLSRPRRFGKSLFVTTLEAYFRGQKELFDGLFLQEYEAKKPKQERWTEYPVLLFSLSGGSYGTENGLEKMLAYQLRRFEKQYHLPPFAVDEHELRAVLPVWLKYCLDQGSETTGRQIVFLVDEYDKPLLDNLTVNDPQEEKNHRLLKDFFSVLKDEDKHLKFAFFTGVTKFNKVSIFSDLNQLEDLSLLVEYDSVCGITQKEMDHYLGDEVEEMARRNGMSREACQAELERKYDGYHFAAGGEGVYNPFSLFTALKHRCFGNYWFGTGTPTFLVRKLAKSGLQVQDFTDGVQTTEDRMNDYRAEDEDVVPLFYQTGYLTIRTYDPIFQEYTLTYPNDEVKYGYLNSLIPMVSPRYIAETGAFRVPQMIRYLQENQLQPLMRMLQALLASIPYHEGKTPAGEQQWRNVLYAVFTVLGQYVRAEVHCAGGRSDCVVENRDYIYIFEFKEDRSAEEALRQIDERGYALPYAASGKQVVKIGVNFSSQKKTLDEWEMEEE